MTKYCTVLSIDSSSRKHEYEKHGTCALTLPALDTEFKYFNTGLDLSERFDTLE